MKRCRDKRAQCSACSMRATHAILSFCNCTLRQHKRSPPSALLAAPRHVLEHCSHCWVSPQLLHARLEQLLQACSFKRRGHCWQPAIGGARVYSGLLPFAACPFRPARALLCCYPMKPSSSAHPVPRVAQVLLDAAHIWASATTKGSPWRGSASCPTTRAPGGTAPAALQRQDAESAGGESSGPWRAEPLHLQVVPGLHSSRNSGGVLRDAQGPLGQLGSECQHFCRLTRTVLLRIKRHGIAGIKFRQQQVLLNIQYPQLGT